MRLRGQKGTLGPCTFHWISGVEGLCIISCSTLSWAPSALCRPFLSLVFSHFSDNALSPHLSPHKTLPHPALCPLVVSAEDLVVTGWSQGREHRELLPSPPLPLTCTPPASLLTPAPIPALQQLPFLLHPFAEQVSSS